MIRRVMAVGLLLGTSLPAYALPPIPGYMDSMLADDPDAKKLVESFGVAAQHCFVCHNGGDKKKKGHALNDFGRAYHKHFDDKGFNAAHKAKKSDEAFKFVKDAWAKTMDDKNADGKTFGELLKAGGPFGKNEEQPQKVE